MQQAPLSPATLVALESFPTLLEQHYAAFPAQFTHWAPATWDGIPSEHFTALEQICHVRDIEIDGYHVRFRRTLDEESPLLASIDSEAIALERDYGRADAAQMFADFRGARATTVELLRDLDPRQLDRRAEFEGYGPVTLRALVHYLCSHDQQHLAGLQWLLGKIDSQRIGA